MKTRIILFIIIAIIVISMCNTVNATANYTVELLSNADSVQQGQQIEITVKVGNIADIPDGIAGLSAKIEYDTTKLEKVGQIEGLNGFLAVEGDTLELAKYPGITSDTEIAKVTFKALSSGKAQIKLTGVEVVNGTDTFKLNQDVTKDITITSDSNPKEELSSNNNLSSISIDGTPITNFSKDTLTYTLASVENNKSSINITATAEDQKSKISGVGIKTLSIGLNTFDIVVTAENGTEKIYKIQIERKDLVSKDEKNEEDNKSEVNRKRD